jgi:hypothetical protein
MPHWGALATKFDPRPSPTAPKSGLPASLSGALAEIEAASRGIRRLDVPVQRIA